MHDIGDGRAHDHDSPAYDHDEGAAAPWKHDGVGVIPGDRLDPNTAQTSGMFRQTTLNAEQPEAVDWVDPIHKQP